MNIKTTEEKKNIVVTFWGVRGSIPAPGSHTVIYGGNTSCVSIEVGDKIIILDAGSGIRMLGNHLIKQNRISGNKIHLFISHTHWDHIQGLPFFASAFIKGNTIKIYGPKLFGTAFEKVISNQMEHSYFPIRLKHLSADISFNELLIGKYENLIDEISVETMLNNHPVIDMSYKFFINGKKITYVTDFECYNNQFYAARIKSSKKTQDIIGRKLFNDLRSDMINFISKSDLLIIDAAYLKKEYHQKLGWGHSTFEDIYEISLKAKVKNLVFFHHDPNRKDSELSEIENYYNELNNTHKKFDSIQVAREGASIIF